MSDTTCVPGFPHSSDSAVPEGRLNNKGLPETNSLIPEDKILQLKQLFAEDGITLNDAQALEIGLWLVARVRSIARPIPLDKRGDFGKIKKEITTFRRARKFHNLFVWRRSANRTKSISK